MQPILRLFIALTCIWKAIGRVASLAQNYKTLTLIFSTLYFFFCCARVWDSREWSSSSSNCQRLELIFVAFENCFLLFSCFRLSPSASHGVNRARFKPVIWNFSSFFLSNFGARSGDESEHTSFEILISDWREARVSSSDTINPLDKELCHWHRSTVESNDETTKT